MSLIGLSPLYFSNLILEHLIPSVVSLAQLVSPSVALPAQLVYKYSIHVQNLPFPFPFRLTERSIANSKVDIRQVAVIFLNP